MTMQPAAVPPATPTPIQSGDSGLISGAMLSKASRDGRRGTRKRPENTSIYTQVVEEVREFSREMRDEFKVDVPFMKQKLTRAQIRSKLNAMSPAEKIALSRKIGVRRFAEFAQSVQRGAR